MPQSKSDPRESAASEFPLGEAPVGSLELLRRLSASEQKLSELLQALEAARERERLLIHELQHRVRNMLAVIRSVYRRSRESAVSIKEFANHFEGRLNAVARYQTALTRLTDSGVELEDIIRDELLAVQCVDSPNLEIAGPPIRLSGKPAELMGLAIHELTTNAIKFGTLSQEGRLIIEWSVVDVPVPGTLHFRWTELGTAPLPEAPRQKGFGRQLLEDALPYELGGTTSFELKPGGIVCTIDLPDLVKNRSNRPSSLLADDVEDSALVERNEGS